MKNNVFNIVASIVTLVVTTLISVVLSPYIVKTIVTTELMAAMAKKYGVLKRKEWKEDLKKGFDECMRVLEPNGILIFKWNEERITVSKVLEVFGKQPLFGHKSGKASKTHWMCFMKGL